MKKIKTKINILGTEYKIYTDTASDNKLLEKCDGYILPERKEIYIDKECSNQHQNQILKHELVHAYLYESGLDIESWGRNEEIVDWIALQLEKIIKTFKSVAKII